MARRGRPKKTTLKPGLDMLDLYAGISNEARENLRGILNLKSRNESWRGLLATPPGSLLFKIVELFEKHTDFPLELPFFQTMHFLSAYLLAKNVKIDFMNKRIKPDIWTVILAESGSGKSESHSFLDTMCDGTIKTMPESVSAAKFVMDLKEYNKSLYVIDEFAQTVKRMEKQVYAEELKEHFLELYDGKQIVRRTNKKEIVIDDPGLTIMGMNVPESFLMNMSAESMLDGFAQRFNYVIAKRDPNKKIMALYPIFEYLNEATAGWEKIIQLKLHDVYRVSKTAREAYEYQFHMLCGKTQDIPLSFFRRVMWRCIRYALIYHIVLGKEDDLIDDADIVWSVNLVSMHLEDVKILLSNYGMNELDSAIKKTEKLILKFREQNRNIQPRDVIANVWSIKTKKQAEDILSLCNV